jgi:competence protein ComEC
MQGGGLVSHALRPDALTDDCERAALIVTLKQASPSCGAAVIDLDRVRRQGTLALRRAGPGFAVEAVRPNGVDRPWSPAPAGETAADAGLISRPAEPRSQDVAPSDADLQSED